MIYTVPDYYREFTCLASDCPATCCAGWQIVIDDRSLKKYEQYGGGFGNRLANSIDWEEKTFHQYHGRCAFLNEENLCDMHLEAGPKMMCRTCRTYPKHIEVYDNEREISLSLSCPAVARRLLAKTDKAEFISMERDGQEADGEFDDFLYSVLQDCRSVLFAMAQDREDSLALRMQKILALAHDVQNRLDARRMFEVDEVLTRYRKPGAGRRLERKIQEFLTKMRNTPCESPQQTEAEKKKGMETEAVSAEEECMLQWRLLDYLREFEVLDASWSQDLYGWRRMLYGQGEERYREKKRRFLEQAKDWETEYEQILVYLLFTYFCGAVYDGDAFLKVKMAVVSILILRELTFAQWQIQGEQLTFEDRAKLAWRYSRELEHSDLNLDAMERMMADWKEAGFEALLLLCSAQ